MLIGIKEVMRIAGVGRHTATQYPANKTCPTMPRVKGAPYLVDEEAFKKWLRREEIR